MTKFTPGPWVDSEAYANLIAAAPDLYEALVALVGEDFYKHPGDFAEDWHRAAAALAKARGEPS